MIKQNVNMPETKERVKSYFNKNVDVELNLGRNKYVSYKGKITEIYPALFTVTPFGDFKGKTSYSYAEVMCGIVKIKITE